MQYSTSQYNRLAWYTFLQNFLKLMWKIFIMYFTKIGQLLSYFVIKNCKT